MNAETNLCQVLLFFFLLFCFEWRPLAMLIWIKPASGKTNTPKRNRECELTNTSTRDISLGSHVYRKQLAAAVIPLASFAAAAAAGLRHVIAEQQAGRAAAAPADVSQTPACSRRSIFFSASQLTVTYRRTRLTGLADRLVPPTPPNRRQRAPRDGAQDHDNSAAEPLCWSVSFASGIRGASGEPPRVAVTKQRERGVGGWILGGSADVSPRSLLLS